jgi:rhodanese-related sulfurtransferase
MPMPYMITPVQLMRQIGLPDAPQLFDLRLPDDMAADPYLIAGAQIHAYDAPLPAAERAVLICHRGAKLSQGVAAQMRAHGQMAEVLTGGMVAWRAAGLPVTRLSARPTTSLWVTRARPKIDRIACPWLVQRFVDPKAQFIFVPAPDVLDVAQRFGAIAFDCDGAQYTHRGEACSFDAMIADFGLDFAALAKMARVVRAADTNRHDLAPQAAGLLALSVGLSRQYRDDNHQLVAGMVLYDALYRWARDGEGEGHDWPSSALAHADGEAAV